MEHQDALRRRGVDSLGETAKADATQAQLFDRLNELLHGSGEAVKLPHDKRVAAAGVAEGFHKLGPVSDRAGHLLDINPLTPGLFKRRLLQGDALVEGRDAGIADLQPRAVNLTVLPLPRVPPRLAAREGRFPFSGRDPLAFRRLRCHHLSLTTHL